MLYIYWCFIFEHNVYRNISYKYVVLYICICRGTTLEPIDDDDTTGNWLQIYPVTCITNITATEKKIIWIICNFRIAIIVFLYIIQYICIYMYTFTPNKLSNDHRERLLICEGGSRFIIHIQYIICGKYKIKKKFFFPSIISLTIFFFSVV